MDFACNTNFLDFCVGFDIFLVNIKQKAAFTRSPFTIILPFYYSVLLRKKQAKNLAKNNPPSPLTLSQDFSMRALPLAKVGVSGYLAHLSRETVASQTLERFQIARSCLLNNFSR